MAANGRTIAVSVNKPMSWNPITMMAQFQEWGDPRTRDYPLVVNPMFVFPLIAFYLYFVKVLGPRLMKNREPFEITNIVRVYNVIMIVLNAKFCYLVLKHTYLPGGRYNIWCQGITGYMDEVLEEEYRHGWWYVAVRYTEFLDTVFFVLRKKFNQITHLHVVHHTMVAFDCWFWVLYAPEGPACTGPGHQRIRSYCHVHLLLPRHSGTKSAKVPVVEEAPDHAADCPVPHLHGAHVYSTFRRLRISAPLGVHR
ncbi:hypothetical protein HPB48_005582 [Haemaphysalis longicornis]|uniref:Elongation of very long chain fatty acids protein n=1 Tax=Haemaphysalis longicornis TaxID=44386 RepID=A0A9J6G789_HAELO|nr:hypothetical protein HPB48_005582 [Haemaphysalis longicornis]